MQQRLGRILIIFVILGLYTVIPHVATAQSQPWMNTSLPAGQRASLLLAAMTQNEKLTMVEGDGIATGNAYVGHIPAITRLGIPEINMSDAGAGAANGMTQVTAFPAPITVASSWDVNLMQQVGDAMGAEQKGKGTNVQLAPMMNILRVPQAGRNFEGTGEDPYLTGQLTAATIRGIQGQGILATAKHYVDNEQEDSANSWTRNQVVDARANHEIYLPPFKAAVQAGVGAFMCSYNYINSIHACENGQTQNDWLKDELGFQGWIMSDWAAAHSTVPSANNGLDMEMPGAGCGYCDGVYFTSTALQSAINSGQIPQSRLDDMVLRILTSMFQTGLLDRAPVGSRNANVQSAAHTQTARTAAAQGLVLLKNANNVLPLNLSVVHSIAVIGTAASSAPVSQGDGSSRVNAPYIITPLQGITSRAGSGVTITYIPGDQDLVPVASQYLKTPGGATGLQGQYYNNTTLSGTAVLTRTDANVNFNWNNGSPGTGVNSSNWSARWTGKLTPPTSGSYTLSLTSDDGSRLYINGSLVVDNWGDHADQTVSATMNLTGGTVYNIEIDYYNGTGGDDVHFNWQIPGQTGLNAAATAASQADVVIVVVGETSSEGSDRSDITLPSPQDNLISTVAQANPKTIVVAYTPAQVLMPWNNQVAAILFGGLPGQEEGNALADVLFGDVNPSGKLTYTLAQNMSDYPANTAQQYPGVNNQLTYSEGLQIGYRYVDAHNITPLYPFGHGLSYTTFGYTNLSVSPTTTSANSNVTVGFDVTNTGSRAGAEVAQLYLGFPSGAGEPPKSLKGFQKVVLNAGQTQHITLTLTPDLFSYYSTALTGWSVIPGTYQVMVGASSRDIRLNGQFQVTSATEGTPFNGSPYAIPGKIEAENYNTGGEGISYHDAESANLSGAYRPNDGVDIEGVSGGSGFYNVSYSAAGEWMLYTVNVATTGSYDLSFRVASGTTGGSFHLEVDGTNVTGAMNVPNTGDYQTWTTLTKTGINLTAGQHVFKWGTDAAGGNYNWLSAAFSGTLPTNTPGPSATPTNPNGNPYTGTPYAIPGTVETENYNTGGEGVAYHDTDTTNNGNATYRSGDGVDLESCTDTGCGYNVGYADPGEWLKYTVNVTAAGSYTFTFRVASATTGGSFHLEVDNINVTGAMSVPNTGGWQTWTTLTKSGVSLTAGQHIFKLVIDGAGGNHNWFSVSAGSVPTNTPAPTATKTNTPSVPTNTPSVPTNTPVVPTNTPTGGTTTTVNDATMGTGQNQFNYVGAGWQHGGCTGCYNSDNSWDNTVNDYVTVTFTGTQITLYGVKDPGHGQGAVSIDGGAETTVDFYAATRAGNQLLWSSAVLTNGIHTFKLRVTGTKNASASNTWAVPDRVDILSGSGSATATPTKTNTPVPPTATKTNTPVGPTATNTTVAPTATSSGSISATAWYQVINQSSNLCVDANGGGTSNGTIVLQWTCGTGINQHWQFQPTDSGYYKVYPRHATSLVWDVEFGSTGDGANVLLWTYGGATNQQWQPVALGGGYYKFVARHSGKCLEVPANAVNGTQLQQRTCNGGTNQAFRLVQQP